MSELEIFRNGFESTRYSILDWPRDSGKTNFCLEVILHLALLKSVDIILLSDSISISFQWLKKELLKKISQFPHTNVIKKDELSKLVFNNGSCIYFNNINAVNTYRGSTVDLVFFHSVMNDRLKLLENLNLLDTILTSNGKYLFESTNIQFFLHLPIDSYFVYRKRL